MTARANDLRTEAAEVREMLAGIRADAARIATALVTFGAVMGVVAAARDEGIAEGLAASSAYQATARVQQRRSAFQVITGGKGGRQTVKEAGR